MKLKEGDNAPSFEGETLKGKVSLNDLKEKNIVLYFYPNDNTPGCTIEANGFNSSKDDFEKENCVVIGVSKDNLSSHGKFTEKYGLGFDLISDEDLKIHKDYGIWGKKKFLGKEYMGATRSTFLINSKGKLVKIWCPVSIKGHVADVLKTVKSM